MILILVSIILAAVIAVFLLRHADNCNSAAAFMFGMIIAVVSGISAVEYSFKAFEWFAAEMKASIINREYGTTYTQEEVFWASDVIDTIREIDRTRVELNGDLMQKK